jgi:ABC-2 type transport system permease protein
MIAITALVRKDLILFLLDKRALMLNLLMPILLGAFFGYLFGGNSSETSKIKIAVVNLDQASIAQKIVAGLQGDGNLAVLSLGEPEARDLVTKGKLSAAIVIPAGFSDAAGKAFFGGRDKPDLTIYYDPSQNTTLAMLKGILTQHVMQNVSAELFGGKGGKILIDDELQKLEKDQGTDSDRAELIKLLQSVKHFNRYQDQQSASQSAPAAGLSVPYTTKDRALTSGPAQYNGYAHSFGGMGVQFILFIAINAGIDILLARRLGLWNRLLAAPVSLNTILTARLISGTLIAFGVLCTIFAVAILVFKVGIAGSVAGFLGVALSFAVMAASFGLLIAAFGKTPEAARGLATFATLILVMLGGAWIPSFIFPAWLQSFTLIMPTRWAVDGLDAMTWRGLGLEAAVPAMGVLIAYAIVFGCLAIWKFRRDGQ